MTTLTDILSNTAKEHYAVGSFSPRYTKMILPIMEAANELASPVIVQISEKEIYRHQVDLSDFASEFHRVMNQLGPKVPVVLHLDHTKTVETIRQAIDLGFGSVMIDASEYAFDENVRITKEVVEYAQKYGVSVEAELGRIGTTDFVETDSDEELFTNPHEAKSFCSLTGIDALAPSVGTAHGLYTVRKPLIRYDCIETINNLTSIPLVLHGGSGVPADMVIKAIQMESGGIAKVNIATDLEQGMLKALDKHNHMTDDEVNALPSNLLVNARAAVRKIVADKISNYLLSSGKAASYYTKN